MLAYLARVVPLHLDRIVVKVCHVIVNFCAHKNVGNSVSLQVSFILHSLHYHLFCLVCISDIVFSAFLSFFCLYEYMHV